MTDVVVQTIQEKSSFNTDNLQAPQINVPPELPSILKTYAKAAIRTQPYDLLVWSAAYFKALSSGIPPPVKERIEYPPLVKSSGLTPGFLKVLINQVGRDETKIVSKSVVIERWTDICLSKESLDEILNVGGFHKDTVAWLKFVAICAGYLESRLSRTMVLLIEVLSTESEDKLPAIPVKKFLMLYRYLAVIDCGPTDQRRSTTVDVSSLATEMSPGAEGTYVNRTPEDAVISDETKDESSENQKEVMANEIKQNGDSEHVVLENKEVTVEQDAEEDNQSPVVETQGAMIAEEVATVQEDKEEVNKSDESVEEARDNEGHGDLIQTDQVQESNDLKMNGDNENSVVNNGDEVQEGRLENVIITNRFIEVEKNNGINEINDQSGVEEAVDEKLTNDDNTVNTDEQTLGEKSENDKDNVEVDEEAQELRITKLTSEPESKSGEEIDTSKENADTAENISEQIIISKEDELDVLEDKESMVSEDSKIETLSKDEAADANKEDKHSPEMEKQSQDSSVEETQRENSGLLKPSEIENHDEDTQTNVGDELHLKETVENDKSSTNSGDDTKEEDGDSKGKPTEESIDDQSLVQNSAETVEGDQEEDISAEKRKTEEKLEVREDVEKQDGKSEEEEVEVTENQDSTLVESEVEVEAKEETEQAETKGKEDGNDEVGVAENMEKEDSALLESDRNETKNDEVEAKEETEQADSNGKEDGNDEVDAEIMEKEDSALVDSDREETKNDEVEAKEETEQADSNGKDDGNDEVDAEIMEKEDSTLVKSDKKETKNDEVEAKEETEHADSNEKEDGNDEVEVAENMEKESASSESDQKENRNDEAKEETELAGSNGNDEDNVQVGENIEKEENGPSNIDENKEEEIEVTENIVKDENKLTEEDGNNKDEVQVGENVEKEENGPSNDDENKEEEIEVTENIVKDENKLTEEDGNNEDEVQVGENVEKEENGPSNNDENKEEEIEVTENIVKDENKLTEEDGNNEDEVQVGENVEKEENGPSNNDENKEEEIEVTENIVNDENKVGEGNGKENGNEVRSSQGKVEDAEAEGKVEVVEIVEKEHVERENSAMVESDGIEGVEAQEETERAKSSAEEEDKVGIAENNLTEEDRNNGDREEEVNDSEKLDETEESNKISQKNEADVEAAEESHRDIEEDEKEVEETQDMSLKSNEEELSAEERKLSELSTFDGADASNVEADILIHRSGDDEDANDSKEESDVMEAENVQPNIENIVDQVEVRDELENNTESDVLPSEKTDVQAELNEASTKVENLVNKLSEEVAANDNEDESIFATNAENGEAEKIVSSKRNDDEIIANELIEVIKSENENINEADTEVSDQTVSQHSEEQEPENSVQPQDEEKIENLLTESGLVEASDDNDTPDEKEMSIKINEVSEHSNKDMPDLDSELIEPDDYLDEDATEPILQQDVIALQQQATPQLDTKTVSEEKEEVSPLISAEAMRRGKDSLNRVLMLSDNLGGSQEESEERIMSADATATKSIENSEIGGSTKDSEIEDVKQPSSDIVRSESSGVKSRTRFAGVVKSGAEWSTVPGYYTYVPGIGPPVPEERIARVEKYLLDVSARQAGLIIASNIRHYLCPPLDP